MKFLLIIHFKNALKNRLNLYTRKTLKGGEAMKKLTQTQPNQAQPNQIQAQQTTQQETQKGGEAMIYFVTFPYKVDKEKAKEIIVELRKRFPSKTPIFAPRPPSGKRMIIEIAGSLVIITFPYLKKNPNPNTQQASQNTTQGFSLKDLIKKS